MCRQTDPNTLIARHTHPGVETSYVLKGEIELAVEGKAPLTLKAGESFAMHAKPVATPAPQK